MDAAPYGANEFPSPMLSVLGVASSSSPESDQTRLRSLEWNYGGPAGDDLIANAKIVNNLRSLRCHTIHTTLEVGTEIIGQPPSNSTAVSLPFAKLASLDIWISPSNHAHPPPPPSPL